MDLSRVAASVFADAVRGKSTVVVPSVFVLMGLQYSGKSYLAERIAGRNFVHFWATKVKADYGLSNEDMVVVALEFVELAVVAGFNVVVDYVNHRFAIRELFQGRAALLGVGYRVVFVDTPREVRLARREVNLRSGDLPGRRVISLEQLGEFEEAFEFPQPGEPVVVLRSGGDVGVFLGSL